MRTDTTAVGSAFGRGEAAAFMATGVALVVHIVVDLPLWLAALSAVVVAGSVLVVAARRHPAQLASTRRVLAVGAVAAGAALLAYDFTRLLVAVVFDYEVMPYEAFRHFGAGLVGSSAPDPLQWTAGTLFHVVNGITFGIAYTIFAGRRGVLAGVAFGVGLELVMLALYPSWLRIANLGEFTTMSMLGHVAYGGVLGVVAQRRLQQET